MFGVSLLLEKAKPQLPSSVGQGSQKESWHSFLMLAYPQNIIGNNFSQQHRGWRTCSVFLSKAWKCRAPTWSHHCSWSYAKLWQKDTFTSSLLPPVPSCCMLPFPKHPDKLTCSFWQTNPLIVTSVVGRLRFGAFVLSLGNWLFSKHLDFHCLSSFHCMHRHRLSCSSGRAGTTLRCSPCCSGTRFASWAC